MNNLQTKDFVKSLQYFKSSIVLDSNNRSILHIPLETDIII